jgi:hypothetical protein
VNCCVAPARMVAGVGETVTEFTTGVETFTTAEADFVLSATLMAVTVIFPIAAGAVKRPLAEIEPLVADHVTDLLATVPCTVAENCCVAPVRIVGAAGDTETDVTVGAATVTVAVADFVVSATLVAVTVTVPADAGAASRPATEIVPAEVFQVTDLLVTVPCTVAVNCCVAPRRMDGADGETETELTTGGGGAVTVIVAVADFVLSATLVAVMVAAPAVAAAVKRPDALIVPEEVFHVTFLLAALP